MSPKVFSGFVIILIIVGGFIWSRDNKPAAQSVAADSIDIHTDNTPHVGIQIGHLDAANAPEELKNIRYDFGAQVGSVTELAIATDIGNKTAAILKSKGVKVDVLPATIPIGYKADAFVSIHADGNDFSYVSGYKVSGSSFDQTDNSDQLATSINENYKKITGMGENLTVTDDMFEYYAFNYLKFQHAVSSTTPSAIVETGYITNPANRSFLLNHPNTAAEGIAEGIIAFLNSSR